MKPAPALRLTLSLGVLALLASCASHRSGWSAPDRLESSGKTEPLSSAAALPSDGRASAYSGTYGGSAATRAAAAPRPGDDYWVTQLATRMPGFVVRGEDSLRAVVEQVRTITGLPMVVTAAAEEATLDEGALFEFEFQSPIAVRSVLDLISDFAGPEVVWVVRHDAILFTTKDKAYSHVLEAYDVRELTVAITDFAAPEIGVRPSGYDPDEDRGGAVASRPRLEPDAVVDLIQNNVAPESWDVEGASLDLQSGMLFVRNTPEVQRLVRGFLRQLGAW